MAAILVGGAAMSSEAFAQTNVSLQANKIALNGAKFYMGDGSNFWTVKDSANTNYAVLNTMTTMPSANAAVFEVKNFNKTTKTFELWVDGK